MGPGGELARWRGPNPLSPASGQQPTPRRRSPGPPCLPRGPRPRPAPGPPHTEADNCAGAVRPHLRPLAAQAPKTPPTSLGSLGSLRSLCSPGADSPGQPQKKAQAAAADGSGFPLDLGIVDVPECCIWRGWVMSVDLSHPKALPQPKGPPFTQHIYSVPRTVLGMS